MRSMPTHMSLHTDRVYSTYIFTFDSLGSKHPRAAHLLKNYLQFEAKDKKQIEDPSEAKYKMALVFVTLLMYLFPWV